MKTINQEPNLNLKTFVSLTLRVIIVFVLIFTSAMFGQNNKPYDAVAATEVATLLHSIEDNIDSIHIGEIVEQREDISHCLGYGKKKESEIISAISAIKEDKLNASSNLSISNSLMGKLPGLYSVQTTGQPGEDQAALYIRGVGSPNSATPLYIVDGMRRSFRDLDVEEIEEITILKDAAATAVYGIRGANGVIIARTKRGVVGKAVFSASASMGVNKPIYLPEYTDSKDYVTKYFQALYEDDPNQFYDDDDVLVGTLITMVNGNNPQIFPYTDWVDYVMKSQASQKQANFSLKGGTSRVKYFAYLGGVSQDGLFNTFDYDNNHNYTYKRYNGRSNIDINASKSTKVSIGLSARVGQRNEPRSSDVDNSIFDNIYSAVPYYRSEVVDGKWLKTADEYTIGGWGWDDPLDSFYGKGYKENVDKRFDANLDLKQELYSLINGLSLITDFSYNYTKLNSETHISSKEYYEVYYQAHLDENSEYYYQWSNMPYDESVVYKKAGSSYENKNQSNYTLKRWNLGVGFEYNKQFGTHNIGG